MDKNKLLPLVFAFLTIVVILAATFKLDRMERDYLSQKNHAEALNHLSLVRARIESALNSRLYLTRGLVAFVSNHPRLGDREFNEFAAALIKQQAGIHSIQLARGNVISHIHPLKGNEPAMGLKLLEHGTSREAAQRAITLRKTVVNGPFKLVQGGTALVSRTPVFLPDGGYWGLASILIDQNALFAEVSLDRPHPSLEFAVRGRDSLGASGETFWGDARVFEPNSVRLDISLPNGSWQIAATHKEGWDTPGTLWLRYGGILLALLTGVLVWFLTRNPERLREEIEQATRKLKESEANFRSLLENAQDFIILRLEADSAPPYGFHATLCSPSIREVMGIDDLNDRQAWQERVHPDDLHLIHEGVARAVAEESTYNVQSRWKHPEKGWRWIHAICTPVFGTDGRLKHFNGLILDITQQKQAEKLLYDAHAHLENEVRKRTRELESANRQLVNEIAVRRGAEEALRQTRDELEIRVAERTCELACSNRELNSEISERRRLEKEIIHVAENEQKRIGQELHDGLGQHLTGIAFLGKALEQKLAAQALPERYDAAEIVQLINLSISRTRALARGLFPVELEANGLMAALEQLAANTQTLYGVDCAFQCGEPVLVYDNVVAINLYRIAQEAVLNAVRHGQAGYILIGLEKTAGGTLLKVSDDGVGYDPEVWEKSDGMGLHIMRYRARMLGSSLEIEKNAGHGSVVSVSVNDAHEET
jgi:PAS domain S-box-containing protein